MLRSRSAAGLPFRFRRLVAVHRVPPPQECVQERLQCNPRGLSIVRQGHGVRGSGLSRKPLCFLTNPLGEQGFPPGEGLCRFNVNSHLLARIHHNLRVGKSLRFISLCRIARSPSSVPRRTADMPEHSGYTACHRFACQDQKEKRAEWWNGAIGKVACEAASRPSGSGRRSAVAVMGPLPPLSSPRSGPRVECGCLRSRRCRERSSWRSATGRTGRCA